MRARLSRGGSRVSDALSLYPSYRSCLRMCRQTELIASHSVFKRYVRLSSSRYHQLIRTNSIMTRYPASGLFLKDNLFSVRRTGHINVRAMLTASVKTKASFSVLHAVKRTCGIRRLNKCPVSMFRSLCGYALKTTGTLRLSSRVNYFKGNQGTSFVIVSCTTAPSRRMHVSCLGHRKG